MNSNGGEWMEAKASLAEIVVEGGPPAVHCPVTGIPVITIAEGFDPKGEHSPYVRFVIDWMGDVYALPADRLEGHARTLQERLIEALRNEKFENQNALVEACCELLPASNVVMEYLDPPQGSYDGSICYVCFDHSRDLMGIGEGEVPRRQLEGV